MANLPVPSKEKVATLMNVLQSRKEMFKDLLPKYLTAERLFRVAQLAMSKNPLLLNCTPASFLIAMMDCARTGLEPDGKQAAIIPYGNECQFQPMYQGLIKQAIRNGAAKKIEGRLVYANDKFKLWYDPEPHIEHHPAQDDEGELIGAYAYAKLPDGDLQVEYMNKRKLDHIKAKSRAASKGFSPWQTDEEEMYRKTPVKRLFKYLAVPEEVEYALAADDLAESGKPRQDIPLLEQPPVDLTPQSKSQGERIKDGLKRGRPAKPPEPPQEAAEKEPLEHTSTSANIPTTDTTEGQGPGLDELLKLLEAKGWPLAKLLIKFGSKPKAEWGEREIKMLADMAASE